MKRCIIIDNEDQSEEIIKLKRDALKVGLEVECEQFNIGSAAEAELLTNGNIDIAKVVAEYRKRFKGQTFDLAAFDWDLNDDHINGVELIRLLPQHRIFKSTPKLLYSGLLEEKLAAKIDDFKNDKLDRKDLINIIKTLIRADIKDFVGRDNYEADIIRILKVTEDTLDLIIEGELAKFPEFKFANKFTNKNFDGKTFQEIATILEEHDHLRNDFKKEIIHQVIAHLTESI